jgi:hypothetical protein
VPNQGGNAAGGALVAGLLGFGARAEDRFSERRLNQLTSEQQTMAKMLTTPPRNNQINPGPFNAYARSPALGILLLRSSRSAISFASTGLDIECRVVAHPFFGWGIWVPQSVGQPVGLWWCSRTMANCTHCSEATRNEPAGVFSANAGAIVATARMTAITDETIRINVFLLLLILTAYRPATAIVHRTIK